MARLLADAQKTAEAQKIPFSNGQRTLYMASLQEWFEGKGEVVLVEPRVTLWDHLREQNK